MTMARVSTEERLRRILAMVPWIVATDGPTVEAVCARFGCDPAGLASDIELLYLCGLHPYTPDLLIEAEISDDRVWIRYAEYFSRPLRLTAAEGLSLLASANALLGVPGTDPEGPLARGLAKLAQALGSTVDAVDVALGPVTAGTLERLRDAAQRGIQVELDYYTFGKDARSRRTVEPGGVFMAGGLWYLSAFCHSAADERVFRLDRIVEVTTTERPRTRPPAPPAPTLFSRRSEVGEVVLLLDQAARWVIEQYPTEEVTELAGGRLLVRLVVTEWGWLDRLMLRLGSLASVREVPPGWPGAASAATRVLERYRR